MEEQRSWGKPVLIKLNPTCDHGSWLLLHPVILYQSSIIIMSALPMAGDDSGTINVCV
jgi:hypothetical protein